MLIWTMAKVNRLASFNNRGAHHWHLRRGKAMSGSSIVGIALLASLNALLYRSIIRLIGIKRLL